MDSKQFFDKVTQQLKLELPFVIYCLPNSNNYKGFFQNTDNLILTKTFEESGFVFAPYQLNKGTVIFTLESSEVMSIDDIDKNEITIEVNSSFKDDKKDSYLDLIDKAIKEIGNSYLSKVVLSRCIKLPRHSIDVISIFKDLAEKYPNACTYLWYHPKVGMWIGATPENFLKLEGHQFSTMSLAGTKKIEDNNEVVWTDKEVEEQNIVTEYLKDQLSGILNKMSVSEVSNVKAGELMHLLTKISGKLHSADLKKIIERLHPTPAVCGQPKTLAQTFIRENEGYDREYYTGFLGELNLVNQSMRSSSNRNIENRAYRSIRKSTNLFVNLRCAQLKEKVIQIYVGGGITKNSVAENEWQETVNKSKTIGSVIAF